MRKLLLSLLLFISISSFAQIPNTLSATDKVYGLSKLWQEVNYNFVYLEHIDKTIWDNRFKAFIPIVQNTKNDYEYYHELQKFYAFLKDGHTNVMMPGTMEPLNSMFGTYRLFLKNINDKAIIVRVNLSRKNEIPLGSEIIEVNGLPTQNYIAGYVAPFIASSTDYVLKDESIRLLLQGLPGMSYDLKILTPDKKVISLTITHAQTIEKEVFPAFDQEGKLLDFKWMDKSTAYLALNSFADPKIDSLFIQKLPELYKAKKLIIDLRNNTGGDTRIGSAILKYLTNDTLLYGARSSSREHIPSYKAWGANVAPHDTIASDWNKMVYLSFKDRYYYNFEYAPDTVRLDAPRLVVPTVILIGPNTASAAEDFLIYADKMKHITKIGQRTFGSTGQPYAFDLPGGGRARVCTKKDTYPDGRLFVGYGIIPDMEVIPTQEDYMNKKDPVLEKAIYFLKKK